MSRKAACVMGSKRQAVPPNLVRPSQNVKNFVPGIDTQQQRGGSPAAAAMPAQRPNAY
jgi:hypothetical protein